MAKDDKGQRELTKVQTAIVLPWDWECAQYLSVQRFLSANYYVKGHWLDPNFGEAGQWAAYQVKEEAYMH